MSEQREVPRRRVCLGGRIAHEHALSDTACRLRDLSRHGAQLHVSGTVPLPRRFDLVVDRHGAICRAEVVWRRGSAMGVRFLSEVCEDGTRH